MKKLITIIILTVSISLTAKTKDLSKVYQKACWKKYKFNTTLALHFCPSYKEIKQLISKAEKWF